MTKLCSNFVLTFAVTVSLLVGTSQAMAGLVTSAGALGASDFVEWSTAGVAGTYFPDTFSVSTNNGVSISVSRAVCLTLASGVFADKEEKKVEEKVAPALNFTMHSLEGKPVKLSEYQGKVVLIVNVASQSD